MYKLTVNVPITHADAVREAIGLAGAGKLGKYEFCSFSIRGVGRFKPTDGAHPAIGEVGKLESVEEEQLEAVCQEDVLQSVVAAIRRVHPYEEVPLDVWELSTI